ncbi:unnamed protein product [Microthlaspi erraticum]|uniref:NYN domain-containing protein n=1 Tax=Microthlaspi erraticum TaxID=1685480 RepID=A0A6D2L5I2_9BRAS|nr:unnamed protein product [Microthlaspi erraticum]
MGVFGNSKAAPEFVNSKTTVLWDMDTCPVPVGYDARRVRPSIESALKNLGYLGPVTISAMGNLEKTPAHVLQGLSSTGIAVTNYVSVANGHPSTEVQSGYGKPYWGMVNKRQGVMFFGSAVNPVNLVNLSRFPANHATLHPQVLQISPRISPAKNISKR